MRLSAVEALTNAVVGLFVSWLVTLHALPLWGLEPSPLQAGGITAMYFVISFLRAWVIREWFRNVYN